MRWLVCFLLLTTMVGAQPQKLQFAYLLRLVPAKRDPKDWTPRDQELVKAHFALLESVQGKGELILAGRTFPVDPEGFGIVVLEVDSQERAQAIMDSDPPYQEGMMTARMFPFKAVLERK